MREGALVQIGTPNELLARPRRRFRQGAGRHAEEAARASWRRSWRSGP
ncbi:MAG: hypothetical protein WDM81_04055 [Rhizomicrobium sp.]